jgi:large subunit ribosomal protein L4
MMRRITIVTTTAASRRLLLHASRHSCPSVAHLSSLSPSPKEAETLTLPPNLTIDVRSSCSPVYGLERVKASALFEEQDDDDEDEEYINEDKEEDEEEEEEQIIYDLSTRPEPIRAISLPDRLFVNVFDKTDGTIQVGTLYLSEYIFGHDEIRIDLITKTVQYQRNQKRGKRTAVTKTISQVSGSGRKVRQQKGTGMARAGHSRPPHWKGGAKAHGPKGSIQDYANCKLNKKTKRLALAHALSQKLKEGNLILVNDFRLETHKTKELANILETWHIAGRHGTTAYICDHVDDSDQAWRGVPVNLSVAAQNLHSIKVTNQLRLNVYDILKHEKLVMTVGAVTALEARLEPFLQY